MKYNIIISAILGMMIGTVVGLLAQNYQLERALNYKHNKNLVYASTAYKPQVENIYRSGVSLVMNDYDPDEWRTDKVEVIELIDIPETLNAYDGVFQGPEAIEKYYNLPMGRVVQTMRNKGYSEEEYPYWVREDGVKCLGKYVIVAASLNKYDRGDTVQTSLGEGIVCDTGAFFMKNPEYIDIAVEW